jgi:hypothetical protein
MNEIKITVTDDNYSLTISTPSDIPLTSDGDCYYSWRGIFATILFWLSWSPDNIDSLMPDCEDCQKE